MILGCCGAGKSTFAKKLHTKTQIPLVHLDQHFWKPNWVESNKEEWTETVAHLVKEDEWIMDGNYGGTMEIRYPRADTIIFLKYATITCFSRVIKRIETYKGKVRPDMPEECQERYDAKFLWYVLNYNRTRTPNILKRLKSFEGEKKILVFKTDQEAEQFLKEL